MRALLSVILIFVVVTGCNKATDAEDEESNVKERYIEKQLPFTDLFYFRVKNNQWIRSSENIMTVHETFKKTFYKKYLTAAILDQKPFVDGDLYYNIPLRTKIDSLIITYPDFENATRYYREFWNRRKTEDNDSTVNIVLTEVKKIIEGEEVETREGYHNETLQKLIDIWSDFEAMSTRIGLSHYEFFKTMDMHQSAYNLLYESMFYDNIDLNRDSLESLLKTERIDTDIVKPRSVFIMDNTK
jgi:hypothetical protein